MRSLAGSYDNITVLSQTNSGPGTARNTGFKAAKGEYVWFVDSDDYLVKDCFLDILPLLQNNLDILQIQYQYVYENSRSTKIANKTIINGIKSGIDVIKDGGLDIPPQFSIFRRKFLLDNNLCFLSGVFHEDTEFKPRALYWAKKVTSLNKIVYNHMEWRGSITSNKGFKHAEDLIVVSSSLISFYRSVHNEEVLPYFTRIIACNINWILKILKVLSKEEQNIIIDNLKRSDQMQFMEQSPEFRYRIESKMLQRHFDITRFLYCNVSKFNWNKTL
jgi:glycosyltransferase involved in cell wall biosynthesis